MRCSGWSVNEVVGGLWMRFSGWSVNEVQWVVRECGSVGGLWMRFSGWSVDGGRL